MKAFLSSPYLITFLAAAWSATFATADAGPPTSANQPTITGIRLAGTNVLVSAQVPTGLKRVVLQSSQRLGTGAWEPRAVRRLAGGGGSVTFQVARSPLLEMIRVRAETNDPVPAVFFGGPTNFPGLSIATATNTPVSLVSAASANGVPVSNGVPAPAADASAPPARDVVESDIWQVSGQVLYFFNQYRGLQVIDLANPDTPAVRGVLSLPAVGEQMYVLPDQTVVLLARNDCSGKVDSGSQVLLVNTTANASPSITASLPLDGQIQESRLVGTALYVMTQTYQPVPGSNDGSWEWGTGLYAFDLSNPASPVARPNLWYSGYGNVLYATDQYLFVSLSGNTGGSLIQCIDISAPDGTMQKASAIAVAGNVADKFKMQLNGSVFSAISERWASVPNKGSATGPVTTLETFSLADPTSPQKLGELQLANGEQLHATRFDGNRVYIVTFYQVDPLWVVDLSDPAHPAVKGQVKVPGWSTYIQPLGDRLLTIGIDTVTGWRVAVSLFDVHDPAAPALLSKIPLGDNYSWSEATADENAFGFLPDAGLVLVPFSSYSTNNLQGVQLIDYNGDSLVKRGFISHDMPARRSTAYHDRILSLSGLELLSVDATDRDHPAVRSATTLAWSVDRVFVQGNFVLELETSASNSGTGSGPTVRVASSTDPNRILNATSLTNIPIMGAEIRDNHLYLLQGLTAYGYPGPIVFAAGAGGSGASGASAPGTNQTALICSILDLSKLPDLPVLASTDFTTTETLGGNADPVWPSPNLLVWVIQQRYYWPLLLQVTPGIALSPGPAVNSGVATAAGIAVPTPVSSLPVLPSPVGPFWFPYGGYGDGKLYAVDVKDPLNPQFVSEVVLDSTNSWSNFSKGLVADGSVYMSQQLTETTVTGTNLVIGTNITYVLGTNVVVVTNFLSVPHEVIQTNSIIVTNVSVASVRNQLGDLHVMSVPAGSSASGAAHVIAGGARYSLALTTDGQAWAWGSDSEGELGDGENQGRSEPMPIPGLTGLVSVASGALHSLALKSDGTVWAWGNDAFGQLGHGSPPGDPALPPVPDTGSATPIPVVSLKGVIALGAGDLHSLAVSADGTVQAWGANWAGQLGDGTLSSQPSPVPVWQLAGVVAVAAGETHSLALAKDGFVWAWGGNDAGQLGDDTVTNRNVPDVVAGLSGITAIACGSSHSLALSSDGTVWTWGANDAGQLGDGTTFGRAKPGQVAGLDHVVAVACGHSHSLALKQDGTVWAWGRNQEGQIGDGSPFEAAQPVLVENLPALVAVAAGASHSLAAGADGAVYAWGNNLDGQLGNGQALMITNSYTQTNYVTTTTWTVETTVGLVTNLVKIPQSTIVTNIAPVYTTREVYYLHVVDYTAPATPVARQPITVPGALRGVSQNGALVYLLGYNVQADPSAIPDGTEWLHACAYDGVSCFLVDSHPLKLSPHAVLVSDPYVFITRPDVDKTTTRALETWTLASAGKFTQLSERPLGAVASSLFAFNDLLVAQEDNGLELFDLTKPSELPLIGQGSPSGCVGWSLDQGFGSSQVGFWLPLGLYGTQEIEVKK
jgi:alpha-tubulin suppressor-like RCC1 family protein